MAEAVTPAALLAARDRAVADKPWIKSLMHANARNRSDDPSRWSPIFTATVLDYAPASRRQALPTVQRKERLTATGR